MTVPGSNNLAQALSIQGKQACDYFVKAQRSVNEIGQFVNAFQAPFRVFGAGQPAGRSLLTQLGIEFQQGLFAIYFSQGINDIDRNSQGDQVVYGGRQYQVLSKTSWVRQDQWDTAICADQGPTLNQFLNVSQYNDPGEPEANSVQFLAQKVPDAPNVIVIDIPKWTIGDGYINPIVFGSGLTDGDQISVNVSISGQDQGQITVVAAGGTASDSAGTPFPGLNSFGLVAGGLRVQHNVRLTIASASVSALDITLSRGVVAP